MTYQTFDEIRSRQLQCGHQFFDNSVNLIAVRHDNFFDNGFTDTLYLAYRDYGCAITDPNRNQLISIPWTTLAGSLGHGGALHPKQARGFNITTQQWETTAGVAILKAGQYLRAYQFVDNYAGWLQYPYFQQVAPVDIYRDADKDLYFKRGAGMTIQRGLFGINIHRMSGNGKNSNILNTRQAVWSEGCQGATEPEFKKILPFIREDARRFGNLFSYTVIEDF